MVGIGIVIACAALDGNLTGYGENSNRIYLSDEKIPKDKQKP
jgi:hypothetical protein